VIWIGAIGAVAALMFGGGDNVTAPARRAPLHGVLARRGVIASALAIAALANGTTSYGLQPVVSKGQFEGGGTYAYREWNTFSRIAVGIPYRGAPHMWGPSPRLDWNAYTVEQRGMNIDGDAGTTAIRFTGDFADVDFLRYDVTNLAYFLPDRTRAAVIGVGGGRDVLSAALFGYRDITAVELNPVFVDLLTQAPYADFTNLGSLAGLNLVVDEGRSWFARTAERFDVIQMSLIDTWAATGAGAFSLSENGLYTVEAWGTFLDRLTAQGVYTVSRWYNPDDPTETARMLSLAVAALLERGITEPRRHIVLAAQRTIATLVVSREPLSPGDLALLEERAAEFEHRLLIGPNTRADAEILERIANARDRRSLEEITGSFAFDLTPPTDERPFFFNQVPLDRPLEALRLARDRMRGDGGVREGNLVASATLLVLFFVALAFVLATIVIPLRSAVRDVGRTLALGGTLYFVLIGLGFMLIEIGLLQRTSIYLGHPVYSLSVLLFTLILATGIGSLLSDRVPLDSRAKLGLWAAITAAYAAALPLLLGQLFGAFDAATLLARAVLCIAVIAPAGVLMGFAFPTGMQLIGRVDRKPTPWFWGVNGAAGVLASIVAIACSIAFGISVTLALGALCYALLIPVTLGLLWRPPAAVVHRGSWLGTRFAGSSRAARPTSAHGP
jgi:hypothetical protein